MVNGIIDGQVYDGVDALLNSLPHIRSGAMRALAIMSQERDAGAAGRADRGRAHRGLRGQRTWNGVEI